MTKSPKVASTAVALAIFLTGEAYALTLTNRDTVEQRIQISEDRGKAVTRDVVLAVDQTLDDLCEAGCTITLQNGVRESFEGYEVIYIENGRFVIAQ